MTSTDRRYFDDAYETSRDPWNVSTSSYERRKYELTLSSLPRERYRSAFEPGCSIGVLSEHLARRCDRLLCTDITPVALDQASSRLAGLPHVSVEQMAIPESWPHEEFDLIVLSEVAYYFDARTLANVTASVVESTTPGAHVMGVHWRGETDYPLTADEVHGQISACRQLHRVVHHLEELFVLDVWERTS